MSTFQLQAVLTDAVARTGGLDDFGDSSFLEGLNVLLQACDAEANLNPVGRSVVREDIIRLLGNRLSLQKWWRLQPVPPVPAIVSPVFIIGLPRTGTTLLQNLLALDDEFNAVPEWLAHSPCPPMGFDHSMDRQRIQAAQMRWEFLTKANPTIKSIHEAAAESVAECQTLMAHEFKSFHFACLLKVPGYVDWLNACDMQSAYQYHNRLLCTLQSTVGRRYWVLKSPSHIYSLDALLSIYPDARIVITHRHPEQVLPSFVSLLSNYHVLFAGQVDRSELTAWSAQQLALGLERLLQARQHMPKESFIDIHYHQLLLDPVGTVKNIYHHFGDCVRPQHEESMRRWLVQNPQNKHGRHTYPIECSAFSAAAMETMFGDYITSMAFGNRVP